MTGDTCSLGSWGITSYNSATKELRIPASHSGNNYGCYGTKEISRRGSAIPNNQKECEEIGWMWYPTMFETWAGQCFITENWAEKIEKVTYDGKCTQTCLEGRGCGGVGLAYQQTGDAGGMSFDGFHLTTPTPYNTVWVPITCSGTIIVKLPQAEIITLPETPTIPETIINESLPTTTQPIECKANIECVSICGIRVPTCVNNACRCDNIEIVTRVNAVRKSIFDNIASFIQDMIDKILSIFER